MESKLISEELSELGPFSRDISSGRGEEREVGSGKAGSQWNWSDTLFYDPLADGPLDIWLSHNQPSTRLNNKRLLWLAVAHPESDVDHYKRTYNRLGQTSLEVIKHFKPRLCSVRHEELLTTAFTKKILKGYWMMHCRDDKELDDYWLSFALHFYKWGHQLKYSRLECRRNNRKPGGTILVINDNFTDEASVISLSQMCNIITKTSKTLYYKPAFYTDLGMYWNKGQLEKSYIFRSDAGFGSIDFMGNEWVLKTCCRASSDVIEFIL